MSTKIYNGLRTRHANVFASAKLIRETIEPMFHQAFNDALIIARANPDKTWGDVFDLPRGTTLSKEKIGNSELIHKLYNTVRELRESPIVNFSMLDFGYTVLLLPNAAGDNALALLFGERLGDAMRDSLKSKGVVEEYGYWNNTDAPDDVSETDWEERELAWSKLDVPSEDGLLIEMPSKFAVEMERFRKGIE